jgi:DNA repair protein RadC
LLSLAPKTISTAIIISHNHPTGVLKPSQADILLTEKIREAAKLLDIELLDHLIVSNEGYYSFALESKMYLTHAPAGESVDAPKAY